MAFTSTKREDMSTRLRSQQINAKETDQLQVESRNMEDRLKELKLVMSKEKEKREQKGGNFWKSGEAGDVTTYGQKPSKPKDPKSKSARPRKMKILKDEPIVQPERSRAPGTIGYIAQRGMSTKKESKIKGPRCGQCEDKGAHVTCQECAEDYCAGCFAAFHLKGALKKHRSFPIGSNSVRTPRGALLRSDLENGSEHQHNSMSCDSREPASSEKNPMKVTLTEIDFSFREGQMDSVSPESFRAVDGGQLLSGQYDEADSAASFQAALKAWRKPEVQPEQSTHKAQQPTASHNSSEGFHVSHGTSTSSGNLRETPEIKFHGGGLSYAEKLLLKKHRRCEIEPLASESDSSLSLPMGSTTPRVGGEGSDVSFAALHEAAVVSGRYSVHGSRSFSRISVIELDEPQYQVTEDNMGEDRGHAANTPESESSCVVIEEISTKLDQRGGPVKKQAFFRSPPENTSAKNKRIQKSASGLDVSQSETAEVSRDSSDKLSFQIRSSSDKDGVENNIKKKTGVKEKHRSQNRPKSRTQSRTETRTQSRAKSRAETRTALFGEGVLTKTPSSDLKAVSQLAMHTQPPEAYQPVSFLTVGVKADILKEPSTPRTARATPRPKEEKWKISNKLYQMTPRSWRPDSSLGETIADSDVERHLDEVGVRQYREFMEIPIEDALEDGRQRKKMTWSISEGQAYRENSEIGSTNHPSMNVRPLYRSNETNSIVSRDVITPRPLSSQGSARPQSSRQSKTRPTSSSYATANPIHTSIHSPRTSSATPRLLSSRSQSRCESQSGRISQMIVVDGDDMSSFDSQTEAIQNAEDEDSLDQLEWELASQTGQVTADGKLSRLSLLDDDEEDTTPRAQSGYPDEVPTPVQPRDDQLQTPPHLRESMMDDFEEMEQQFIEEEVKALV